MLNRSVNVGIFGTIKPCTNNNNICVQSGAIQGKE